MGLHILVGFSLLIFALSTVVADNCSSDIVDPTLQGFPVKISPVNCTHRCGGPVTIQYQYNSSLISNSSDVWTVVSEGLYYNLPAILRMYLPDSSDDTINNLAAEGTSLIAYAVVGSLHHDFNGTRHNGDGGDNDNDGNDDSDYNHHHRTQIERRDIWGDIANFFGDLGCDAFATTAIAGFALLAGYFDEYSVYTTPATNQDLFFAHAAMQGIPSNIKVDYYGPFSGFPYDTFGITFGTNIYLNQLFHSTTTYNTVDPTDIDSDFSFTTSVVTHEIRHVLQYRDHGWNQASFGYDYLYNFCKSGFNYNQNPFEVEAFAIQASIQPLLSGSGAAFFNIWGAKDLQGELGYPSTTTINLGSWMGDSVEELDFDYGKLEIRLNSRFYRVWVGSDLAVLNGGYCQIVQIPNPNPHPGKGCPPACGKPPNINAIKASNAACKVAKKKSSALYQSKAWIRF
jgi:hypothetical protein